MIGSRVGASGDEECDNRRIARTAGGFKSSLLASRIPGENVSQCEAVIRAGIRRVGQDPAVGA